MNKVELQGKVDRLNINRVGEKMKSSFTVVIKKVFNNREFTDYVPVEIWKNLSGLENGDEVRVEGSFTTQSWDNKEGGKSYKSLVVAYRVFRVIPLGENDYTKSEPEYSTQSNYKNNGNSGDRFEYNSDSSPEDIF